MNRSLHPPTRRHGLRFAPTTFAMLVFVLFFLAGCQKSLRVTDPQLKPIQAMIEEQLPLGSTTERVTTFLATRGYDTEPSEKPGTIVAIIRHIDTKRVEPVTARVTFYFDANGKLNTVDIVRTMNQPVPSSQR